MPKKTFHHTPAFLRRNAAAYHVGVSPRQLDKWVAEKKVSCCRVSDHLILFKTKLLEAEVSWICGIEETQDTQSEGKKEWSKRQIDAAIDAADARARERSASNSPRATASKGKRGATVISISTSERRKETA